MRRPHRVAVIPPKRRKKGTAGNYEPIEEQYHIMDALSYRVILEPDEDDGGFNVIIPAFPTAHTQGDDVEDALGNAREVIALELGFLRDKGLPIPPSDAENVRLERVTVALPAA